LLWTEGGEHILKKKMKDLGGVEISILYIFLDAFAESRADPHVNRTLGGLGSIAGSDVAAPRIPETIFKAQTPKTHCMHFLEKLSIADKVVNGRWVHQKVFHVQSGVLGTGDMKCDGAPICRKAFC
jgi:hypothetical protein